MRQRLLLVDDEPDILDLLAITVRGDDRCGDVRCIDNLDDVLAVSAAFRPHAIVLDLMFGHRTCVEILPELRTICPDAHIIVFTSSQRAADRYGVGELGADHVVQKVTVSFEELAALTLHGSAGLPRPRRQIELDDSSPSLQP